MTGVLLEKIFYHYSSDKQEYSRHINDRYFDDDIIKKCFQIRREFQESYSKPPSEAQLIELIKVKGIDDIITPDKIRALYDVDLSKYQDDWIVKNLETWIEYKNLDLNTFDLVNYLKTAAVTPENIAEVVQTAKNIILEGDQIDFTFDLGLEFSNAEDHYQDESDTYSSGYPSFDLMLGGGYTLKSLVVIAGGEKVGKSIWLANMAAQAVKAGMHVPYISLEMKDKSVIRRFGSNFLSIPMSEYKEKSRDSNFIKQNISTWKEEIMGQMMKFPGELYVKEFPTSSLGVPDLERYLLKVEEIKGIKFKLVCVDYINIMKNWRNPNTENTYMKIKQIAEDLRGMAQRNNWTILTATQLTRTGAESTDPHASDVAESKGLNHTVDFMAAIIQDEIMHANNEYMLKSLLSREAGYKNAKQYFGINYEYMRITQDMQRPIIVNN
jgi:KaiC/GvpD/RAD55 family RecA-like ATPase